MNSCIKKRKYNSRLLFYTIITNHQLIPRHCSPTKPTSNMRSIKLSNQDSVPFIWRVDNSACALKPSIHYQLVHFH